VAGSDFIQPIEEECAFSVAHREVGGAGVGAGSLIPTAEPTQGRRRFVRGQPRARARGHRDDGNVYAHWTEAMAERTAERMSEILGEPR